MLKTSDIKDIIAKKNTPEKCLRKSHHSFHAIYHCITEEAIENWYSQDKENDQRKTGLSKKAVLRPIRAKDNQAQNRNLVAMGGKVTVKFEDKQCMQIYLDRRECF